MALVQKAFPGTRCTNNPPPLRPLKLYLRPVSISIINENIRIGNVTFQSGLEFMYKQLNQTLKKKKKKAIVL